MDRKKFVGEAAVTSEPYSETVGVAIPCHELSRGISMISVIRIL
jgi:hypothetical protein